MEAKAVGHVGRKSGSREGIICSAPAGVNKLDKSVAFYTQELHGTREKGKILDLVAGTGITCISFRSRAESPPRIEDLMTTFF